MAGAIDKKINDVIGELEGAPLTHVEARANILADIALSREFADTFLQAICQNHTGGKNSAGNSADMSLAVICETLAAQRLICHGAGSIKGNVEGIKKFTFPPVTGSGTLNGSLGLTEPSTSTFGIKATDIIETNTITLSNSTTANQTIDGNNFSTYVGNYYMVRSRVSGELEPISGNISSYTTPDGVDNVFGNTIAWVTSTGGDVSGELEANTWNYHWAKANVASVAITGSGATELTTLTLSDVLTQGSNTDYTPLGPSFANKFYLKRHADSVNTFTITGTSTTGTVDITDISETDIAKVKYGDVISGTGIPDDNVSIAAVQTAGSKIRLSNTGIATTTGTITLTVNSVPFGHAAHDIFCQVEIVAEGLVVNDNWKPVGDDDGVYSAANEGEDELLVATTTEFKNLLQFFNPSSPNNDLTRGASASLVSDGKEYGGTNYPDIETNAFFPANLGTTAEKATKQGEFTGTQPEGLGNKDVWVGRYVAWNKDRMNKNAQAVGEYRYVLDNAERFFYAPSRNDSYSGGNSLTVVADPNHPATILAGGQSLAEKEPRAVLPRSTLSPITGAITTTSSVAIPASGGIDGAGLTKTSGAIPVDGDTDDFSPLFSTASGPDGQGNYAWGTAPPASVYASWYTVENGYIIKNEKRAVVTLTPSNANGQSPGHSWAASLSVKKIYADVTHNFYQRLMTISGGDVEFLTSIVSDLKGSVQFRDPNVTETTVVSGADGREIPAGTGSTSLGISDKAFDDYILSSTSGNPARTEWDTDLAAMNSVLSDARDELQSQVDLGNAVGGRIGNNNAGNSARYGSAIAINDSNADIDAGFTAFTGENTTLLSYCDKRVQEVDARIGIPKYLGSQSSRGTPPNYRVAAIPSSNTSGGQIPYGRSIYNNVNHLLGQEVDLMGGIIKDIESLTDLIGMVESARNKYDIFSGNDKVY